MLFLLKYQQIDCLIILIIHFKRFRTSAIHNVGSFYFPGSTKKVNSKIEFDTKVNISEFVHNEKNKE